MNQHEILVKHSIDKAKEALKNSEFNLSSNFLFGALNRAYYAIFYSVMGLGYLENFKTSKHSNLMGWFNKKFIKEEKTFSSEIFKVYKTSYEYRTKGDYNFDFNPSREEVEAVVKDAQIFFEEISKYINKKL